MTSTTLSVFGKRKSQRHGGFRWPPMPTFTFYSSSGKILLVERDADLDLFKTLMLDWPKDTRTIHIGISSHGKTWPSWTESRINYVEGLIRYDLCYDGCRVRIKRVTNGLRHKGSSEFRWTLSVRKNDLLLAYW